MTGSGVALPDDDEAQVRERTVALEADLRSIADADRAMVRSVALYSVRLERSARLEAAYLAEKIRSDLADFDETHPAWLDPEVRNRDRARVAALALFDASRQATLARKYEGAAGAGLRKTLDLIDAIRAACPETPPSLPTGSLASFLPGEGEHVATYRDPTDPSLAVAPLPSFPATALPDAAPRPSGEPLRDLDGRATMVVSVAGGCASDPEIGPAPGRISAGSLVAPASGVRVAAGALEEWIGWPS